MLEIDGLTISYPDFSARYDLKVSRGALCALIGPSGGGKTTLLNAIAGFEHIGAGRLAFDGLDLRPLTPAQRPLSFLFQEHNLLPHLTGFQNVALGIHPGLKLSAQDRERVHEALRRVELDEMAQRLPEEMSGGQRQRIAIARALVRRRPLMLLDEPFGALDPGLRREMIGLVDDLRRESGVTVLLTLHTPEEALGRADLMAFVANGRVEASGKPQEMMHPGRSAALDDYFGRA